MYNSTTEDNIRQIPVIAEIDIDRLPQELTAIYAQIISIRRDISSVTDSQDERLANSIELLRSLANNLEILAVNVPEFENIRSVAFVSATTRYLLLQISRIYNNSEEENGLGIDEIPEAVSAMLLFLIGNSPADAAEVSKYCETLDKEHTIANLLLRSVICLSTGHLVEILNLTYEEPEYGRDDAEQEALDFLWYNLFLGVRELASELLGSAETVQDDYFGRVVKLSVYVPDFQDGLPVFSMYSGPYHLARLLNILKGDLLSRGIVKVEPPSNVDNEQWKVFLKRIASERPYLWENHFEAIGTGFLDFGNSAVLTFPTGAGKSTLAELKIASALLSGKSVLYLVPTHALEDQVNLNLNQIFNGFVPDSAVAIDLEYSDLGEGLPAISVMTPERCLTLLGVSPEVFSEVGLVVFDEFHLLHGDEDKQDRRSIDAMFCILRLISEAPGADYLLISAMVENGQEIADWITFAIKRHCMCFNSSWKPTRQLHGCIMYAENDINELDEEIRVAKKAKTTKGPPAVLKRSMLASPYTFFSLRNKWESEQSEDYLINQMLPDPVLLALNNAWELTGNRNEVAKAFGIYFAQKGIKTLVFVNSPIAAKSAAEKIVDSLPPPELDFDSFKRLYPQFFDAIEVELGTLRHSYVSNGKTAVHHGNMLPIERRVNEMYFKKKDGINIMVATATLAQGINLPAEVVIMAGDDRFDEETERMKTVGAHEILNAAGRAGRAGSVAQGLVLLIPGDFVTFQDTTVSRKWWNLKEQVFSQGDQCLLINDPFTSFLDTLSTDSTTLTADQKNIIFRLSLNSDETTSIETIFQKSLGYYRSMKSNTKNDFDRRIKRLADVKALVDEVFEDEPWVSRVSLKMGLEPQMVKGVGNYLDEFTLEELFEMSITDIIGLVFAYLKQDQSRVFSFFSAISVRTQLGKALNLKAEDMSDENIFAGLDKVMELLVLYVTGANYEVIEESITGANALGLDKARNFCLKLVPNLSFMFGIFSIVVKEKIFDFNQSEIDIPFFWKGLASFIREGLDTEEKLRIKMKNPPLLRMQVHARIN